jgi:hypothetical protein
MFPQIDLLFFLIESAALQQSIASYCKTHTSAGIRPAAFGYLCLPANGGKRKFQEGLSLPD